MMRIIGGTDTGSESFPATQRLRGYWEALREADGAPPLRARLDPRGIGAALSHTFIGESVGPGLLQLRICGKHLSQLMGSEMQGMPLSCLFLASARDQLADSLARVARREALAEIHLEAERGIGRAALHGRLLLLPLAPEPGRSAQVLGCLETRGEAGRRTRRFAIAARAEERMALPGSLGALIASAPRPVQKPAPQAAAAPVVPRTAAHLRLVHSAD